MCEVMQKYEEMAKKDERIDAVVRMLKKGYSKEDILDLEYTEEEYRLAEKYLGNCHTEENGFSTSIS